MNDSQYMQNIQAKGIRPSVQRIAIYGYLWENRIHPTVDTVFTALSRNYPTLSKTTVYNTLHLFSQHNLIQEIKIEDDEVRYDANTAPHIHFKCTKCGNVYDVFMENQLESFNSLCRSTLPEGFTTERSETNLWGTCSRCNKKQQTI